MTIDNNYKCRVSAPIKRIDFLNNFNFVFEHGTTETNIESIAKLHFLHKPQSNFINGRLETFFELKY